MKMHLICPETQFSQTIEGTVAPRTGRPLTPHEVRLYLHYTIMDLG